MMTLAELVDELTAFLMAQPVKTPFIFGISGGQGAGKSTLCQALDKKLAAQGKASLTLSLDDFYLSKAQRQKLAKTVHPLCATRGVPGTHDVARLADVLSRLNSISAAAPLAVPRFSKSHDDGLDDVMVTQRPDFVFLEGWCVGGHAGCIDTMAQNEWEATHDGDAIWKSWSREAARAYQPIWDKCGALMLLRQEDFDAVIDSRWEQEKGNAAQSGVWQFADRAAVAEFCAHYQSWTLGIWEDLTPRADFVIGRTPGYDYYPMRG
jgi:D-glycerate 3-kinase